MLRFAANITFLFHIPHFLHLKLMIPLETRSGQCYCCEFVQVILDRALDKEQSTHYQIRVFLRLVIIMKAFVT